MRRLLTFALITLLLLAFGAWRQARLESGAPLPLRFAHADHDAVNCIACHHEFVDATPRGPCIECHLQDPLLRVRIETDFHDLCRDCHLREQQSGSDAGPTRHCHACHQRDEAP